jgi:hypothetical protein
MTIYTSYIVDSVKSIIAENELDNKEEIKRRCIDILRIISKCNEITEKENKEK